MKIAVFGAYAPTLTNFRLPMMRAMIQEGHEVVALSTEEDTEVRDRLAEAGIQFRAVPLSRTGMNPMKDLVSIQVLTKIFQEMKPDVLLSYTIKPVIYGSMAAARAGVPGRFAMITGLGYSLQGQGFRMGLLARVARLLYRRGLALNQGVFFQNADDHAFFVRHHLLPANCDVTLINGSGVDLEHFLQVPQPESPLTFIMVARLVRDKGLMEYAEAARLVRVHHPEVRFLLLGPFDSNPTGIGPDLVAAWESEGILEYLGQTRDVRSFMAMAHVVVLPSYGEGTPHSVLEGIAMGRAVITTLAPGCRETVLPERTGFLVPTKDAVALAEAMERFIKDPSLAARMGTEGRSYAEARYDVHAVNHDILRAMGLVE